MATAAAASGVGVLFHNLRLLLRWCQKWLGLHLQTVAGHDLDVHSKGEGDREGKLVRESALVRARTHTFARNLYSSRISILTIQKAPCMPGAKVLAEIS